LWPVHFSGLTDSPDFLTHANIIAFGDQNLIQMGVGVYLITKG